MSLWYLPDSDNNGRNNVPSTAMRHSSIRNCSRSCHNGATLVSKGLHDQAAISLRTVAFAAVRPRSVARNTALRLLTDRPEIPKQSIPVTIGSRQVDARNCYLDSEDVERSLGDGGHPCFINSSLMTRAMVEHCSPFIHTATHAEPRLGVSDRRGSFRFDLNRAQYELCDQPFFLPCPPHITPRHTCYTGLTRTAL